MEKLTCVMGRRRLAAALTPQGLLVRHEPTLRREVLGERKDFYASRTIP